MAFYSCAPEKRYSRWVDDDNPRGDVSHKVILVTPHDP